MNISLSWLRDYVDVALPLPELVERLTLAGLEVAGVRLYGLPAPKGLAAKLNEPGPEWAPDKVVTAQILEVTQHPNADRLKLVRVNYGAAEPKVVVTAAPNINLGDKGQKVILGLAGTRYFDGHVSPKQIKELKATVMRGVPSDAMVMSEYELGITDEHEGIIVLDPDAPVGMPLVEYMGDAVLEVDVLPNMARCLAMLGVAREVAALTGKGVCVPSTKAEKPGEPIDGQVKVEIADPKLCGRYRAVLIRGVTVGPAPAWMRRRLAYSGMRPINNLVDVTNYVMLEWGQPLHAFDYDALVKRAGGKPPTIIVRPAKPGEKLVTLDKVERTLTPEHLLIADTAGPIALAGVMGGLETEVTDRTKNVLLESASFDFVSIRKTARAFELPSEASTRFSKGIHPEVAGPAADRAAKLMAELAGGAVAAGAVDNYPAPRPPQVIDLKLAEVKRLLGMEVPAAEAERILTALEFKVERAGDGVLRVTAPPNRTDIQEGPADLIEDLARLYGYDRLPATLLSDPLPAQLGNASLAREERVRDLLANAGLTEVITYALTTPEREALLSPPAGEYVKLLNPISSERTVMRRNVLTGVLDVAAANLRNADSVRLFEVGPVYLPRPGEKLPEEPRRLAVVMAGRREPPFWADAPGAEPAALDFYDLKGVLESLAADLHLASVSVTAAAAPQYLYPGRAAELRVGQKSAGLFGQLHPKTAKAFDLGDRPVLVAELDLEAILAAVPERYNYEPLPRFPAALRDVAVIVPESVTADQVVAELRKAGGELLRDARLFDVYRGESIPPGTKSLAYALTYQADRNLDGKDVDKAHKKIEDRLKHVLKAQIRGKEEKA